MDEKFIKNKFNINDSGTVLIRSKTLLNGRTIAFGISVPHLTTLQFVSEKIDFDKESDKILERFLNSQNDKAFEYMPNVGFGEVGTDKQSWFTFNNN